MKNKLIMLLLVLLTLICLGCNTNQNHTMYIDTEYTIMIQDSRQLKVYYNDKEIPLENLDWTLSDYSIASIEDGVLYAKEYGVVVVGVVDITNPQNYCSKSIEIIPPQVKDIVVEGVNQLYINKTTTLEAKVEPSIIESPIIWESSNTEILIVDEGEVLAVGVGVADIILTCDDFVKKFTIEVLPTPTSITISGKNVISVNEVTYLTFNIEDSVTLSSSNNEVVSVVDNVVVGVNEGTAIIFAVKDSDNSVKGTFEIKVVKSKNTNIEMTMEERQKIDSLLNTMTLDQMVGEMFNVGFDIITSGWGEPVGIEPETGLPYAQFSRQMAPQSVIEFLKDYKIGNFTIHSASGKDRKTLQLATKTLKEFAVENTGVNPFISIRSNGGYLMSGITSLPTNVALSNAKADTIYAINELYGTELRALGVNNVISQYVLNNYDSNSTLNMYGTDIKKAMATATLASQALSQSNVLLVPELGNSSYYSDNREYDDIKKTDWKLIETAIKNGSQMISLPASVYIEKEDNYYGLLSAEYMKLYIREELNYDGIILAGNSALNAILYDEKLYDYVTLAINLGVDMLSFDLRSTNSHWSSTHDEVMRLLSVYDHIIAAVENEAISLDRIKEAVTRILLVKLRNNIIDNNKDYSDFNYNKVASQITNYAPEFISIKGERYIIEKEDKVLFISESFEYTDTQNSLGDNLRKFFEIRGYKNIDIYHYDKLTPSSILDNAKEYDKIFVAISTVGSNTNIGFAANRMNFIQFMGELTEKNPNVCVIATGMPDQLDKLPTVNNAILLYNYYESNFESLCKVLNNEVTK